jgi:RimJ/RimL family protein N-acetyltransferase
MRLGMIWGMKIWPSPSALVLQGQYCRLEPLQAQPHGQSLFESSMSAEGSGADARFRYLFDSPSDRDDFDQWLASASASVDPLFFAVVAQESGRCLGRQALMRFTPEHGVIEIGHILWGPGLAQTRMATEALYLHARYVFETLGYRRFEWKCNAQNAPSRAAALRFGFSFEGVFRQHMMVKGQNRDTAWFSMLDSEWPRLKQGFESWLRPENFVRDVSGSSSGAPLDRQIQQLRFL